MTLQQSLVLNRHYGEETDNSILHHCSLQYISSEAGFKGSHLAHSPFQQLNPQSKHLKVNLGHRIDSTSPALHVYRSDCPIYFQH